MFDILTLLNQTAHFPLWVEILLIILAPILSVWVWKRKRTPKIQIRTERSGCSLNIYVSNSRDAEIEINYIRLVKPRHFRKPIYNEGTRYCLIDCIPSQIERENIPVEINGIPVKLPINFEGLCGQYKDFLPFKPDSSGRRYLASPTIMPKCAIALFTSDGKHYKVDLPKEFYVGFKENEGSTWDFNIRTLLGRTDVSYPRASYAVRKADALDGYYNSRRNYYLLMQ